MRGILTKRAMKTAPHPLSDLVEPQRVTQTPPKPVADATPKASVGASGPVKGEVGAVMWLVFWLWIAAMALACIHDLAR